MILRFIRLALLTAVAWNTSGCRRLGDDGLVLPPLYAISDVVEWVDVINLAESDTVINVTPAVTIDPGRGFLVADAREAQIRLYTEAGSLTRAFGRKGGGPGEFHSPVSAIRLHTGDILVADASNRLVTFDPDGAQVLHTVNAVEFMRITTVRQYDDSTLLISARIGVGEPLLHFWDLRADTIRSSFFNPGEETAPLRVSLMSGWAFPAINGDTIAVTFSVTDTVFYFDHNGRSIGQVPIPSQLYRRPTEIPASAAQDFRALNKWLGQIDLISSVFWLENGDLLIAYQTFTNGVPDRSLLSMSPDGVGRFEVEQAPQLLATSVDGTLIYFVERHSVTPNKWGVARLAQ